MSVESFYLGLGLDGSPVYLVFDHYPSVWVVGPSGSFKSMGVCRTFIENLVASGWHVIYVVIKPDFMGLWRGNWRRDDLMDLKVVHRDWFFYECGWRTWGIPLGRISVLVSPFCGKRLRVLAREVGLPERNVLKWPIPISEIPLEALLEFYGGKTTEYAAYFKDLREVWEDVRERPAPLATKINLLETSLERMAGFPKKLAKKFINRMKYWISKSMIVDTNILKEALASKGCLTVFYFNSPQLTSVDYGVFATFIYTTIDTCNDLTASGVNDKFCLIVDDVGSWTCSPTALAALETLVQRRGRAAGIMRVLVGQSDADLKGAIREGEGMKTFDFRIETSRAIPVLRNYRVKKGVVMRLVQRETIYSMEWGYKEREIEFISRPPLTSYGVKIS